VKLEEPALPLPPEKRPEGMSPKEFLGQWGLLDAKKGLWLLAAETTMQREANQLSEVKAELSRKQNLANLVQKRRQDTERMSEDLQKQVAAMAGRLRERGVATSSELRVLSMSESQLDQVKQATDQAKREVGDARAAVHTAMEKFAAQVAKLRQKHEQTRRQYAVLAASPAIRQGLADLSSDGHTPSLGPAEAFRFCDRKLAEYEDLVASVSARIPIVQRGKLWYVEVELNGRKTLEMAIDTGAEVLCVPWKTAIEAGLDPERGKPVRVQVADGTTSLARQVTMPVVRVGRFEARNVECTVLPIGAGEATPLLGQTFLGEYSYRIDAGERMLLLSGQPKDKRLAASGRK
jgi:clan AA aspartic protease (TIGR02281 family)